ncbi:MAG: C-terminal binding protein [Desulfobacterales bacterium]|nr:C-terminal binding protein [Desulfobacterales bacterium]
MQKVVITDFEYPDVDTERGLVESAGAVFAAGQAKTEKELIEITRDADVVINQYGLLTPKVISEMKKCRAIVRYGIGLDTIDIPFATKMGIMVCNVPNYGIHEVSDHTIAMLLGCVRKLAPMNAHVKKGTWDCNLARPVTRICGRTLGLVGFGNIPRMVAEKLAPWNLNILAYDPYIDDTLFSRFKGVKKAGFDELLSTADYVSCHVPLTDETRHMFGYEQFCRMKPDAYFINTSRGPVVNEKGLKQALDQARISGAALDVLESEPAAPDNPLLGCDNLLITPHMAWYSREAGNDLQRMAGEEAVRVLKNIPPLSCVNLDQLS